MIIIKDNFLSTEKFTWLQQVAKKKAKFSLNVASKGKIPQLAKFYTKDNTAWDLNYKPEPGNLTIPAYSIGHNIISIIDDVQNLILEFDELIKSEELVNVYFMFSTKGYEVHKHTDIRCSSTTQEELSKIYKIFIFCHENWSDDYGGELCFNQGNYLPLPNRLVCYSNDELHWVEPIKPAAKDNIRMIFGLRYRAEKNE